MNAASKDNFGGMMLGLVIPALQSFVTGLFLFLFMWPVLGMGFAYSSHNGVETIGTPLSWATIISSGGALLMFLNLRARWHSALEILLGMDLNQDGYIGSPPDDLDYAPSSDELPIEPVTREEHVKVFVHEGSKTKIFNAPISAEKLVSVCKLLLERSTFTYADFSGPGKLLSRRDFELLRQELVSRGILSRDKSGKPSLTLVGKRAIEAIIRDNS